MNGKVPHIVQYQGSKRKLAPQILQYMPERFSRLVEPFSGMAAISVAVATENRTNSYYINDLNAPLITMLQEAIEHPAELLTAYRNVWTQQFAYGDNHTAHFYEVRERFNQGEITPANMLYLLARCVKGAVRYNENGNFNQSPDKRRHGTSPANLERNLFEISRLLKGRTIFSALDYRDVLAQVQSGDLVYMDPPYQGVTNVRDNRYISGVDFDAFVEALEMLNQKNVDYLVSYDGECGGKGYGQDLPEHLGCKKILLNAGISSQATLLGKKEITMEALYISESLLPVFSQMPQQLSLLEVS
jgi:DNA adenine methylase